MNVNLEDLEKYFFTPSNIFWKQKNGKVILISKKGDVVNFELVKKLQNQKQETFFDEELSTSEIEELTDTYHKHAEELLIKNKIPWRDKFIELFKHSFLEISHGGRLKLNTLALRIFWNGSRDELLMFDNRDELLFRRSLSIASDYSYCAFFLGYYDQHFLTHLFSKTLRSLMFVGESERVISFKQKMEELRLKEIWSKEDIEYVKTLLGEEQKDEEVLFEKLDGKGLRELSYLEMDDLEVVLVALNTSYEFNTEIKEQKISEIIKRESRLGNRVFKMLKTILEKKRSLENVA